MAILVKASERVRRDLAFALVLGALIAGALTERVIRAIELFDQKRRFALAPPLSWFAPTP